MARERVATEDQVEEVLRTAMEEVGGTSTAVPPGRAGRRRVETRLTTTDLARTALLRTVLAVGMVTLRRRRVMVEVVSEDLLVRPRRCTACPLLPSLSTVEDLFLLPPDTEGTEEVLEDLRRQRTEGTGRTLVRLRLPLPLREVSTEATAATEEVLLEAVEGVTTTAVVEVVLSRVEGGIRSSVTDIFRETRRSPINTQKQALQNSVSLSLPTLFFRDDLCFECVSSVLKKMSLHLAPRPIERLKWSPTALWLTDLRELIWHTMSEKLCKTGGSTSSATTGRRRPEDSSLRPNIPQKFSRPSVPCSFNSCPKPIINRKLSGKTISNPHSSFFDSV